MLPDTMKLIDTWIFTWVNISCGCQNINYFSYLHFQIKNVPVIVKTDSCWLFSFLFFVQFTPGRPFTWILFFLEIENTYFPKYSFRTLPFVVALQFRLDWTFCYVCIITYQLIKKIAFRVSMARICITGRMTWLSRRTVVFSLIDIFNFCMCQNQSNERLEKEGREESTCYSEPFFSGFLSLAVTRSKNLPRCVHSSNFPF